MLREPDTINAFEEYAKQTELGLAVRKEDSQTLTVDELVYEVPGEGGRLLLEFSAIATDGFIRFPLTIGKNHAIAKTAMFF